MENDKEKGFIRDFWSDETNGLRDMRERFHQFAVLLRKRFTFHPDTKVPSLQIP